MSNASFLFVSAVLLALLSVAFAQQVCECSCCPGTCAGSTVVGNANLGTSACNSATCTVSACMASYTQCRDGGRNSATCVSPPLGLCFHEVMGLRSLPSFLFTHKNE